MVKKARLEKIVRRLSRSPQTCVYTESPLAEWVAYRIGGPAQYLVESSDSKTLAWALKEAGEFDIPLMVVGNGTNLLFRDGGWRGLVLYVGQRTPGRGLSDGIQVLESDPDRILLDVPAHCSKARLLEKALEKGWAGLEFSAGIPGSLGGAVYMNAGTKWGSYADVIESVLFFHPDRGLYRKKAEEIGFQYRGHGEGLFDAWTLVVSVRVLLRRSPDKRVPRQLVDEILTYRGQRQPLELPNCGSVFKNPLDSPIGAGRLIEACGLKGQIQGGAQVSCKHANFILNRGGATARDVETLIHKIRKRVYEEKGVRLEPEVIIRGEA